MFFLLSPSTFSNLFSVRMSGSFLPPPPSFKTRCSSLPPPKKKAAGAAAASPGSSGGGEHTPDQREYSFDAVYPPTASQADVFADARPLVRSAVDGHNVCVFAYGQTGSGKTHTVYGDSGLGGAGAAGGAARAGPSGPGGAPPPPSLLADPGDPASAAGLAPRAAVELFRLLDEGRRSGALAEAEVGVSMLELYCDELSDLLPSPPAPSSSSSSSSFSSRAPASSQATGGGGGGGRGKRKLEIRRDPRTGTVAVPGAARARVSSASELLSTIISAAARRRVSPTLVRSASSFSVLFPL